MEFKFNADVDTYNSALKIFKDTGIDMDIAINIFLKKVIKDRSVDFMFTTPVVNDNTFVNRSVDRYGSLVNEEKMTKSMAKVLFANQGIRVLSNSNIGSVNKSLPVYWSNPRRDVLNETWHLILNNTHLKKLYLFEIPTTSNLKYHLVDRSDKKGILDIRIQYGDSYFTDIQSGCTFAEYKIAEIDYE